MSPIIGYETSATQVEVARSDRWCIQQRLQELEIVCSCPADGTLQVEVDHAIAAVLVRSVVKQFLASRVELVDWLERCQSVSCTLRS